jgi:predicted nucleic acid-binding protein
VTLLEEADAIMVPFVVVGELRAGFAHGRRQAENERILRRFLVKDGVQVLFADDQTTHHYASTYRGRNRRGLLAELAEHQCISRLPLPRSP